MFKPSELQHSKPKFLEFTIIIIIIVITIITEYTVTVI